MKKILSLVLVIALSLPLLSSALAITQGDYIWVEYAGQWTGSVGDINLSFNVGAAGTGTYTFEQGSYSESYDFSLSVESKTFSVQIPKVNQLGIVSIDGTYAYADGVLTLEVQTTFANGQVFAYTVPCQRTETAMPTEDSADDMQLAAMDKIAGSWSIRTGTFSYVETGIGGFDGSFSVGEEGQRDIGNILVFDSSGSFHSEFSLINDDYFAGESLNLAAYSGWRFVLNTDNSNDGSLSGELVFTPVTGDYEYTLSLSEIDMLTLTVSELYSKQSVTTDAGFVTKGGEVPMTYTFTLVRTPED